jgi:hypothetical protein
MKFNEAYFNEMFDLLESMNLSIGEWNNYQKDLWLHLVDDRYVARNDAIQFFRFGKMFRNFYDRHGKLMTYDDVLDNLDDVIQTDEPLEQEEPQRNKLVI